MKGALMGDAWAAVRVEIVAEREQPAAPPAERPAGQSTRRPVGMRLVRVAGDIDVLASHKLRTRLRDLAADRDLPGDVVLDLSGVSLLSAAGAGALAELADTLAGHGGRLRLVVAGEPIQRALQASGVLHLVDLYPTVRAAAAARSRLDGEDWPVIVAALGIIRKRYDLPDVAAARRLLGATCERAAVHPTVLARVLVTLPRPGQGGVWLSGDLRPSAPALPFAAQRDPGPEAVLGAALEEAMRATEAGAGTAYLRVTGRLRLVAHRGVGPPTPAALQDIDSTEDAYGAALCRGVRLRSTYPNGDPCMLLSTPLPAPDGRCLAVVCTLHDQPGWQPAPEQHDALDRLGAEGGRWLDWYEHDALLGALEYLHTMATGG
jgi:anti-anti-sigma factor